MEDEKEEKNKIKNPIKEQKKIKRLDKSNRNGQEEEIKIREILKIKKEERKRENEILQCAPSNQ